MVFTKVQLWISLIICAVVLANGSNFQMYKNLDSEQEHELLDLDADIDPDTGVRRYDNYQLFRVTPSTDEHIDILQFLNKGKTLLCYFIIVYWVFILHLTTGLLLTIS